MIPRVVEMTRDPGNQGLTPGGDIIVSNLFLNTVFPEPNELIQEVKDVFTWGRFPAGGLEGEKMGGLSEVISPHSYRDPGGRGKAGVV